MISINMAGRPLERSLIFIFSIDSDIANVRLTRRSSRTRETPFL